MAVLCSVPSLIVNCFASKLCEGSSKKTVIILRNNATDNFRIYSFTCAKRPAFVTNFNTKYPTLVLVISQ